MSKVFIVDAYALIYKFYYAMMRSAMRSPGGDNVATVYGFIRYINDLIDKQKPDFLGVAFDVKGGSFRNKMYPLYKANREETPKDIIVCTPIIKRFLKAKGIPVLEVEGYEADDVIGTLSVKAAKAGHQVYMVTPDKDFGQLVSENVYIFKPAKGDNEIEILGVDQICSNYGISNPCQVIDILAIWGDASDNVPGIRGVGEKGASKLVGQFGSVENIMANLDQLSEKQRIAFEDGAQQLKLSKELVTICLDVPIEFEEDHMRVEGEDAVALGELFMEMGFRSLLSGLKVANEVVADAKAVRLTIHEPTGVVQQTLFDFAAPSAQNITSGSTQTFANDNSQVADQSVDQVEIVSYKNVDNTPHSYVTISNQTEMDILIGEIVRSQRLCFDTETTSLEPMRAQLVGISVSTKAHKAYWFTADNPFLSQLKPFLEDQHIEKIGQNIKYDIIVLKNAGYQVKGRLCDTMIMHYLLDPEGRHSMDAMSLQLLGYEPIHIESVIGKGVKQISMLDADPSNVAQYAAEDADVTIQLFDYLLPRLRSEQKEKLYDTIEEPLIDVLVDIERTGVAIDENVLKAVKVELSSKEVDIQTKINKIAGGYVNINSPKQLGVLLFDTLKISGGGKTKSGSYKTDEQTLEQLSSKHEIIPLILEYRGIKKLLSTYVEVLPTLLNPKTNRIHTSFNQAVTATGRLSSSNPNLQNIPIRTDEGREIRRAFVSGHEGWKIVSADYSQVELRIMAHLSEDENLISAFACGEDVHTATAAKIYSVDIKDVTSDQRRKAKMANFGIIYGVSAIGLAQRLQVSNSEARELINNYFTHYPKVKTYMDRVASDARQDGYVETIFGRRRILDGINSSNSVVRSFAERNAVNAPIQGSAADIIKMAMIDVYRELNLGGFKSKILLQVHDELVIEAPVEEVDAVSKLLVEKMSEAAKLSVKLEVEVGVGNNWLEAH